MFFTSFKSGQTHDVVSQLVRVRVLFVNQLSCWFVPLYHWQCLFTDVTTSHQICTKSYLPPKIKTCLKFNKSLFFNFVFSCHLHWVSFSPNSKADSAFQVVFSIQTWLNFWLNAKNMFVIFLNIWALFIRNCFPQHCYQEVLQCLRQQVYQKQLKQ